jgi:hypothetical protein
MGLVLKVLFHNGMPKEMYYVPHALKLCLAYWMQAKETSRQED